MSLTKVSYSMIKGAEVNVLDFGAVGDGVTDSVVAIQDAIDFAAANNGGIVFVPSGSYICSSGLILKRGVNLVGEGSAHHAFYTNPSYLKTGTILLVTAPAAGDCIKFESNVKGHFGIYNMSIYDNGSAAIRSVCNISGILHPRLEDVEFACLNTARGTGLYISNEDALPPFTGQATTIYGAFRNVVIGNVLDGVSIFNDCNANAFFSGSIQGTRYCLYMTGTYSVPLATSFTGVAFEAVYNAATQDIEYVPGANNIHGWVEKPNAYIVKFLEIQKARGTMFSGCYFENGNTPLTYNDGVNGTWDIASVVSLDPAVVITDIDGTDFLACAWNNYLYDKGIRTTADNLPSLSSYTTIKPAALVRRNTVAQIIPSAAYTAIEVTGQTPILADGAVIDYDTTTKLATFRQQGIYLITATVYFENFAGAAAFLHARIVATGYTYQGPNVVKAAGTNDVAVTVTCLVEAIVNDTCALEVFQSSGVNQTVANGVSLTYLTIVKQ
jgi:hypothetical protein